MLEEEQLEPHQSLQKWSILNLLGPKSFLGPKISDQKLYFTHIILPKIFPTKNLFLPRMNFNEPNLWREKTEL